MQIDAISELVCHRFLPLALAQAVAEFGLVRFSTRFTMGLFSSFLGRRGPSPNVAREISLDDYLYLFDYGRHYSDFLSGMSDRARAIAELFLFRGWATQFGFRMFSTHPELYVSIMHE